MRHQCCRTNWWHIMVKEHFSSKILTALLISITPALPPPPPLITLQLTFMINFTDQLINQFIPVHYFLPKMLLYAVKRVACGYWLCLFVCLFFFFRNEISKPQFLVFNSKGALWNLRSLTNQPYWWFYCLFHLTLWCKILKNLCSSVKIERPLIQLHTRNNEMKWKTLTIRVYNVLLVPVILL